MKTGLPKQARLYFSKRIQKTLEKLEYQHQNDRADIEHTYVRDDPADRIQQLVHESVKPLPQREIRRYKPGHDAVKKQQRGCRIDQKGEKYSKKTHKTSGQ